MTSEPTFVFADVQRAQSWVDVCAQSLAIDKAEAAGMLAAMCGFQTWDQMVSTIGRVRPSPDDSQVSLGVAKRRRNAFREALVQVFAFDHDFAKYIVEHACPARSKPFNVFSINREEMYGPGDADALRMSELFGDLDMNSPEMIDSIKRLLGDQLPPDFSFENFEDRVRLSGEIRCDVWLSAFDHLGWEIDEESVDEEAEYLTPSFVIIDAKWGDIPVYCSPLSVTPYDDQDAAAESVRAGVSAHFQEEDGRFALVVARNPLMKSVGDFHFTHIGQLFDSEEGLWHEILINLECASFSEMIDRNLPLANVNEAGAELNDPGHQLGMAICRAVAGIESRVEEEHLRIGSASGWNMLMISPK